jgi:hypothetical protein
MRTRRRKKTIPEESFSIWTSFTDLMSNAFMVLTLLLLLALSQVYNLQKNITQNTPPPFIEISETDGYIFESGVAILPEKLEQDLDGKIKTNIENIISQYQRINMIEVIGHTDGQPIGKLKCYRQGGSNLDEQLERVAKSRYNRKKDNLCPGSNTDLGLMRALSVVKKLEDIQKNKGSESFKQIGFRAYSAGQMILPSDEILPGTGNFANVNRRKNREQDQRRRIEIRFTELGRKQ